MELHSRTPLTAKRWINVRTKLSVNILVDPIRATSTYSGNWLRCTKHLWTNAFIANKFWNYFYFILSTIPFQNAYSNRLSRDQFKPAQINALRLNQVGGTENRVTPGHILYPITSPYCSVFIWFWLSTHHVPVPELVENIHVNLLMCSGCPCFRLQLISCIAAKVCTARYAPYICVQMQKTLEKMECKPPLGCYYFISCPCVSATCWRITENGNLGPDPSNVGFSNEIMQIIDAVINTLASDSGPESIMPFWIICKESSTCNRRSSESMGFGIEQFLLSAQSYLNPVNKHESFAGSAFTLKSHFVPKHLALM